MTLDREKHQEIRELVDKLRTSIQDWKSELSNALIIKKPNNFDQILQKREQAIIQLFPQNYQIIIPLLKTTANIILRTPKDYIFHDFEHTFANVLAQLEILLTQTWLSENENTLLYIAAIGHDIGHLVAREDHEKHSITIIEKLLNNKTTKIKIETIKLLIQATQFPYNKPLENKPEIKKDYPNIDRMINIIRDADIGHLATPNFENYVRQYIKYLCEGLQLNPRDPKSNDELEIQKSFHKKHHKYKTTATKETREKQKIKNLEKLEQIRDNLRQTLENYNFNYDLIEENRPHIRSTINPE